MMRPRRRYLRATRASAVVVAALMMLAASGREASPQSGRTIKIVVPFTAGSPSDILSRLLADEIRASHGPTVIVENRPGGSTAIGADIVARAAPDGGTLLIATTAFVINAHVRKVGYDPLTSFEPVCNLTNSPTVIAVDATSSYRSLADLFAAARARPGALTMAGVGPASTVHIAFERLRRAAGVEMTFVPYPGPPPAISALLGGHVTSIFVPYPAVAEHLKTGRLRALVTGSSTRIEAVPDLPTVADVGFKDDAMDVWFGVVAPIKTPRDTIVRLSGWFTAALRAPDVRKKLAAQGLYPAEICGADFGDFLRRQFHEYGRTIRESKIAGPKDWPWSGLHPGRRCSTIARESPMSHLKN